MLLQVLGWSSKYSTLHSATGLAMTPQHEDAAVQGGQVFAEEMDPAKPQGVVGLEGRRSPCVFFGGVSLKAENNYRFGKKKHVCLFLGRKIWKKSFFAFDCTECGCLGFVSCFIYVECGEVFRQQNTKKLFKAVVRSMHHPKKETEIPWNDGVFYFEVVSPVWECLK